MQGNNPQLHFRIWLFTKTRAIVGGTVSISVQALTERDKPVSQKYCREEAENPHSATGAAPELHAAAALACNAHMDLATTMSFN